MSLGKTATYLPLITHIKRDSLEDGPGIRSVVFFKGCPLDCIFCHNPETKSKDMEIAFQVADCIGCGKCFEICDREAIDLRFNGRIRREQCNSCGKCADVCPGNGLTRIGAYYPIESLVEVLLRDDVYYFCSGGGVTVSGGECTLFPQYLGTLLKRLKALGISTVLETCGYFHFGLFCEEILPHLDIIYFDIKFADPKIHKQYTGRSNKKILGNLCRLIQQTSCELHVRIPLIPEITATKTNLCEIARFLSSVGVRNATVLPYNPLGFHKYQSLGKPDPSLPLRFMKSDEISDAQKLIIEHLNSDFGGECRTSITT